MRTASTKTLLLIFALAVYGCATPPPAKQAVQVEPPQLPPPPAGVMVPRAANFLDRLLNFFSASPPKPTR